MANPTMDLIGQYLGRYHIIEQLGEGGMAVVYKAYDTRLETDVAVKVIRTDTLAPSVLGRTLKRFEREAKSLARLTHANIVKVSDYGEYEGHPFLVMPYLPGGNLKERLKKGGLPWPEAVHLLIPIARALEYAHQQGVIHRDVKPSNILITESGDPMLTDFGVAKVMEDEATVDLTGTAMAIGTPEYMAPEQATSKSIDHRADIYSLGIVLYEMVTGRKPYVADTPLAVLFKQASDPLPRPRQFAPTLPNKVEQIILKALAKKPEDRYQTMGEFATALEQRLGDATSEQVKGKIIQAGVEAVRGGRFPARTEKAQLQEKKPPMSARSSTASTFGDPSNKQSQTVVRGTSSKRMILISGVVLLMAIFCLGAVLPSVIARSVGKIIPGLTQPTVTFTSSPLATAAPTVAPISTQTLPEMLEQKTEASTTLTSTQLPFCNSLSVSAVVLPISLSDFSGNEAIETFNPNFGRQNSPVTFHGITYTSLDGSQLWSDIKWSTNGFYVDFPTASGGFALNDSTDPSKLQIDFSSSVQRVGILAATTIVTTFIMTAYDDNLVLLGSVSATMPRESRAVFLGLQSTSNIRRIFITEPFENGQISVFDDLRYESFPCR